MRRVTLSRVHRCILRSWIRASVCFNSLSMRRFTFNVLMQLLPEVLIGGNAFSNFFKTAQEVI